MFSGLVQEVGEIAQRKGAVLSVFSRGAAPKKGDSIAVNGVCLTVVRSSGRGTRKEIFFELSEETLKRSTLGRLKVGAKVNLERALTLSQGLGGHIVQGHVDGVGRVVSILPQGDMKTIWFRAPVEIASYLVPKGSVTVDGVSLTSAELKGSDFSVAFIPFTLANTTMGGIKVGDDVNLEADVIGKYVVKYMELKGR